MIKFRSRVIRVNEMANKIYVEVRNKEFVSGAYGQPLTDEVDLKAFDTVEEAEHFINGQLP